MVQPLKVTFLCLLWWHTSLSQHLGGRGKAISSRLAWSTFRVPGQPVLHSETLSQKQFYPCIHACIHSSLQTCTHAFIHPCIDPSLHASSIHPPTHLSTCVPVYTREEVRDQLVEICSLLLPYESGDQAQTVSLFSKLSLWPFVFIIAFIFKIYFMCVNVGLKCISVPHPCLVLPEARGGHWIPWKSSRWLTDTMWVLEIKPRSFGRTASALNHRAVFQFPFHF